MQLYPSIPSGLIAMWSGASNAIPSGWFLCDGNNNTPDLRNKFIVGAGSSYEVGATGGSDSITLTADQIPSHGHAMTGLSCSSEGAHTHSYSSKTGSSVAIEGLDGDVSLVGSSRAATSSGSTDTGRVVAGASGWLWSLNLSQSHSHKFSGTTVSAGSHTHTVSGSISNTGGGQAHENRPPYYALCFIMKA